jgi:hypothetical protein
LKLSDFSLILLGYIMIDSITSLTQEDNNSNNFLYP